MSEIYRLINTVQDYPWGSLTAIPELLGQPSPASKPQAELWMGAHPKAPSRVLLDSGEQISLTDLIAQDPDTILGHSAAQDFSGRLPFLFKVLAAAQPLSIQAHPNREQALAGFRRENQQGIALDAFERNYRDDNHKPEVISALTPFWALNGFRPLPEMIGLLRAVGFSCIAEQIAAFAASPDSDGLKTFFAALMRLDPEGRVRVVREATDWARRRLEEEERQSTAEGCRAIRRTGDSGDGAAGQARIHACARWILCLSELYPGDIGVLSPLLLNLILLQPGDTMFLQAGVLHAYLEGTGIELMANSDNVIRGGLTPKHMDVEELLSILRFQGEAVQLIEAIENPPGQREFQTPAREFRLVELKVQPDRPYKHPNGRSIELLIAVQGKGAIDAAVSLPLSKGDSLVIPASAGGYTVRGSLHLYKAYVPT